MEPKRYSVTIKLISNQSPCHCGHKIGDEWQFDHYTPAGLCSWAWNSIFPVVLTFWAGGTFPWQTEPDVITVCCPDVEVVNVFELRRTLKTGPIVP